MLHCKTAAERKHEQMRLDLPVGKRVELDFDGGRVCSDGGLLLLRKADEMLELIKVAALCIGDKRRPDLVLHTVEDMLRQRVYGIAAGYEDCNDASRLQGDSMHLLAAGYLPDSGHRLGSQPTLSRFENSLDDAAIKAMHGLLVHTWIRKMKRKRKPPKRIRLAMDTTCDPAHGSQQLTFYNGFYETACYTPLFVFTDDGFPLGAELRAGNASPADGCVRMLKRIIAEIKLSFPCIQVELTADAGFAVPELYEFCEQNNIIYFIAAAGHAGFQYHSEELVVQCRNEFESLAGTALELKKYGEVADKKARKLKWKQHQERLRYSSKEEGRMQEQFENELRIRRFGEFKYTAREWMRERRVLMRVEFTLTGPNVRYVLTNATSGKPRELYENRYCRRCQCENWIKDLKNFLKCDRTSCQEYRANQFRLFMHVMAYILMWEIRDAARTPFTTVETIRIQFIKIGVLVKETAQKVALKMASHHPWRDEFNLVWQRLG